MGRKLSNTCSQLKRTYLNEIIPTMSYLKDKNVSIGDINQSNLAIYSITPSCYVYFKLLRLLASLFDVRLYQNKVLNRLGKPVTNILIIGTQHDRRNFEYYASQIITSTEVDIWHYRHSQASMGNLKKHLYALIATHRKELIDYSCIWVEKRLSEKQVFPKTLNMYITKEIAIAEYIKHELKHKHLKKEIRATR